MLSGKCTKVCASSPTLLANTPDVLADSHAGNDFLHGIALVRLFGAVELLLELKRLACTPVNQTANEKNKAKTKQKETTKRGHQKINEERTTSPHTHTRTHTHMRRHRRHAADLSWRW